MMTDAATDGGAPMAVDALFSDVYERLKAMAHRQLARHARDTLDTTALVHELYLRMGPRDGLAFAQPGQFFAYAARAMRHLLANRAREQLSLRAGGAWLRITLSASDERLVLDTAEHVLAIERGLQRLEREDARAAQVVELRYFAGLSLEQVAGHLKLARRTIDRDWSFARAFLRVELDGAE